MAMTEIISLGDVPATPLALYASLPIGELSLEQWGMCDIFVGLSLKMVERLITRTGDTSDEGLALTRDAKRFASKSLYESWYAKGRLPFVLTHRETESLMALVWFGEKMPDGDLLTSGETNTKWSTIAYRSYPPYRGTGFMTIFTQYALRCHAMLHPDHALWAQVDVHNEASLHFAKKLGFVQQNAEQDNEEAIFMVYAPNIV